MKEKHLKEYLFIFCLLAFLISIGLVIAVGKESCKTEEANWAYPGQIGDFFGGVVGTLVAAVGFILIYLSFVSQTESQEKQEKQFNKSQIESRFFELIKLHRDNIEELVFRDSKGETKCTGRRVFKEVYTQIKEALTYADILFKTYPVENCLSDRELTIAETSDIGPYARIILSYSIVFFGVSKDDDNSTVNALNKHFKEEYSKIFYQFYRLVPATSDTIYLQKWKNTLKDGAFNIPSVVKSVGEAYSSNVSDELILTLMNGNYDLFSIYKNCKDINKRFGGHQHKLGHYFRHIFQTVRYIDEQTNLSYKEKYDYLKTFRAQLSNYEQMVFFFNSIHSVGRALEMDYVVKEEYGRYLISKYNFIKNIPDVKANDIDITKYYPLVDFEFEEPSKTRKAISEQYWGK